jgi:membrane-associated phospholipid phosphatase
MRLARWLVCMWLCLLALAASARADDVRPFRSRPALELPLLAVGAALWIASEAAKPALAPAACRWCRENGLDRGVRDGLHWGNPIPARKLSDWLLFALVPAASLGGAFALGYAEADVEHALTDVMVVTEALVLSSVITQVTKLSAGRMRPWVRLQREESRDFVSGPDDHLSFFSGHTSATFALAVAAGTTATLRGYRRADVVWAVGMPLAALTGYLRIAADRHYFSDVLTGALIGSLAGVLVPYLHARGMQVAMSPRPPAMLTVSFTR